MAWKMLKDGETPVVADGGGVESYDCGLFV